MDTFDLTGYVELIGNVGFPIVVTLILLRTILSNFNKRLDALEKRLVQLNKTMMMIVKALDREQATKINENSESKSKT